MMNKNKQSVPPRQPQSAHQSHHHHHHHHQPQHQHQHRHHRHQHHQQNQHHQHHQQNQHHHHSNPNHNPYSLLHFGQHQQPLDLSAPSALQPVDLSNSNTTNNSSSSSSSRKPLTPVQPHHNHNSSSSSISNAAVTATSTATAIVTIDITDTDSGSGSNDSPRKTAAAHPAPTRKARSRVRSKMADYAHVARDALHRVDQLLAGTSTTNTAAIANPAMRSKQPADLCLDLIADAIFFDAPPPQLSNKAAHRNKPHQHQHQHQQHQQHSALTLTQEFQLVTLLCDHFNHPATVAAPAVGNALCLSLFGSGAPSAVRPRVLAKLVSTAISGGMAGVLEAVGTWLQQMGPASGCSTELARQLVADFVEFSRNGAEKLRALPALAPRFCVNLMTAVAELYWMGGSETHCGGGGSGQLGAPAPLLLVTVCADWLLAAPQLALGRLDAPALPAGAIAMPLVTPLAGLLRWCVLAPLGAAGAYTAPMRAECSRLHMAVMMALMAADAAPAAAAAQPMDAAQPQPLGMSTLQLGALVTAVRALRPQRMDTTTSDDTEDTAAANDADERADASLQAALDRFAQAVQVGLGRAITGNVQQLMFRLEQLPANDLMRMVVRTFRARD